MDYSADIGAREHATEDTADQRGAPRYISLIRAAKLACGKGEFVCVIRDVSATGISLRTFHAPPADPAMAIVLQNGESYAIHEVRRGASEASYRFAEPVEVDGLIRETSIYPKRQIRLDLVVPCRIRANGASLDAVTINLSQQGARVECDAPLAIDQTVELSARGLFETQAKVRWRRERHYGLVFENTLSLGDFARLAARVQCPALLD